MKKFVLVMGFFIGLIRIHALGQEPGFHLVGIGSLEIPVTMGKMTNLVFPVDIQTGVKVSKGVIAQKVKGVENVIELKAAKLDFATTNLSVYGKNGRLYSFVLRYVLDSSVLNFRVVDGNGSDTSSGTAVSREEHPIHVTGLPADMVTLAGDADRLATEKGFLKISTRRERMGLTFKGIYLRDSLEWMVFRLTNRSLIPYKPVFTRFYSEDRKKVKRKAIQQVVMDPVYDGHPGVVVGGGTKDFSVGFTPFTLAEGKRLIVEISEPDGGRVLELKVKAKTMLKARMENE